MKVVLQSEIIEKLTVRGILAYVAVAIAGRGANPQELGVVVHVKPEIILDGLKSLLPLQNLDLKSQKKSKPGRAGSFSVPMWIDAETWEAFEEMRNKIRKPMTDRARNMIVRKLEGPEFKGHNVEDVLNQSIVNCWQDVFPVRMSDDRFQSQAPRKIVETEFKR